MRENERAYASQLILKEQEIAKKDFGYDLMNLTVGQVKKVKFYYDQLTDHPIKSLMKATKIKKEWDIYKDEIEDAIDYGLNLRDNVNPYYPECFNDTERVFFKIEEQGTLASIFNQFIQKYNEILPDTHKMVLERLDKGLNNNSISAGRFLMQQIKAFERAKKQLAEFATESLSCVVLEVNNQKEGIVQYQKDASVIPQKKIKVNPFVFYVLKDKMCQLSKEDSLNELVTLLTNEINELSSTLKKYQFEAERDRKDFESKEKSPSVAVEIKEEPSTDNISVQPQKELVKEEKPEIKPELTPVKVEESNKPQIDQETPEIVKEHHAKVYSKAKIGAPPMSVPHLDTRVIDGEESLLYGPFAGFSPKFLKTGSFLDLPLSVKPHNLTTMLLAALKEFGLVKYLVGQLLLNDQKRLEDLHNFVPSAKLEDWDLLVAGQRVQVIKKGGNLQFGTEVVHAADGSIAALLGASPGASVAVDVMLNLMKDCFPQEYPTWEGKIKEMIADDSAHEIEHNGHGIIEYTCRQMYSK